MRKAGLVYPGKKPVDEFKPLAIVIDITEHSDELAHVALDSLTFIIALPLNTNDRLFILRQLFRGACYFLKLSAFCVIGSTKRLEHSTSEGHHEDARRTRTRT